METDSEPPEFTRATGVVSQEFAFDLRREARCSARRVGSVAHLRHTASTTTRRICAVRSTHGHQQFITLDECGSTVRLHSADGHTTHVRGAATLTQGRGRARGVDDVAVSADGRRIAVLAARNDPPEVLVYDLATFFVHASPHLKRIELGRDGPCAPRASVEFGTRGELYVCTRDDVTAYSHTPGAHKTHHVVNGPGCRPADGRATTPPPMCATPCGGVAVGAGGTIYEYDRHMQLRRALPLEIPIIALCHAHGTLFWVHDGHLGLRLLDTERRTTVARVRVNAPRSERGRRVAMCRDADGGLYVATGCSPAVRDFARYNRGDFRTVTRLRADAAPFRLALAMGTHARLGRDSPLASLSAELLAIINRMLP